MAKIKPSRKRKSFSIHKMPITKVKVQGEVHSPRKKLRDKEFIALALLDALMDVDFPAFKEIIKAHYEALNVATTIKTTHLIKKAFYDAISEKGNPSLETISKIMQGVRKTVHAGKFKAK